MGSPWKEGKIRLKVDKVFCSCFMVAPDSGFSIENHSKYHWTHQLVNHYGTNFHNIGIGGMSNHEICLRTIDQCLNNQYDLVIVMWTSIGRLWVYYNENNVDDFTGMNPTHSFGLNSSGQSIDQLHKIYYSYFQNNYVEIKHWLLQAISLASFFKLRNQPYIFIKGFENFINDFSTVEYNNGFTPCTKSLSDMLDFKNHPNDFILDKVNNIKNLLIENKKSNWINLHNESFRDLSEDLADDLSHPGPISNKKISSQIIQHIDNQRLL